ALPEGECQRDVLCLLPVAIEPHGEMQSRCEVDSTTGVAARREEVADGYRVRPWPLDDRRAGVEAPAPIRPHRLRSARSAAGSVLCPVPGLGHRDRIASELR